MQLRPLISISRMIPFAALVVGLLGTACPEPEEDVAKAEQELLQKAKTMLQQVLTKTDGALKKGGHETETLFYQVKMKQLSDAARAVTQEAIQTAAGKAAKVTVTERGFGERMFAVEIPRATFAESVKALEKSAGALWIQQVKLTKESVRLELVSWPGSPESLALARSGGVPAFKDIKLFNDLTPYRVSPDHTPQPANKALFAETKKLYSEIEAKQNQLLKQGHSQGVAHLAQTHATFEQGLARLSVLVTDLIVMERKPALFSEGTLIPGPTDVRVTATLGEGVTIIEGRKRARSLQRALRGDAAAAGKPSELSWDRTGGYAVVPVPPGFVRPEGFAFDAKTPAARATKPAPDAKAVSPTK